MADHSEDGNSMFTTSNKKIQLTKADYADVSGMENGREVTGIENPAASGEKESEMAGETPGNIPETILEFEDAMNPRAIAAETRTFQDKLQNKPEISAADEIPGARSAEVQVAPPPVPQPRAGMAMALGLLGVIGASGALWMNFTLSDHMGQLEAQLPGGQDATAIAEQSKEIALLNQRMNTLEATVSSLMAAASKPALAVAATQASPLQPPVVVATQVKPTIVNVKAPPESHQGAWVVNLISLGNGAAANNELKRLKQMGIHAEGVKAEIRGKTWYRIRVSGFASAEDASRQRKILANKLGLHGTWIGKR